MSQPQTPGTVNTDTLKRTVEEARTQALKEGGALKDEALRGLEDTKSEVVAQSEAVKNRAAIEISQTSKALRAAAGELEEGSIQHQMFTQAADAVSGMSQALTDRGLSEIVEDLTRFGRRNPAALIGGAVLAGLVISRFMRASDSSGSPVASRGNAENPYSPSPMTRTEQMDLEIGRDLIHG